MTNDEHEHVLWPVRIDADLPPRVASVAALTGKTICEVLSSVLRKWLDNGADISK